MNSINWTAQPETPAPGQATITAERDGVSVSQVIDTKHGPLSDPQHDHMRLDMTRRLEEKVGSLLFGTRCGNSTARTPFGTGLIDGY